MEENPRDDILYIGTELCAKGSLYSFTKRDVFLAQPALTKSIFKQVVDGVKAMHDNGIFHRDLKADNIFVKEDGSVAIGDFGFATSRASTTSFGMGTPGYVAPGTKLSYCLPTAS